MFHKISAGESDLTDISFINLLWFQVLTWVKIDNQT